MSELIRVSLSIESPLLKKMEELATQKGYENRSEFIRDLIREQLTAREWESGAEVIGTITMVYNHHQRGISEKLTQLQHDCTEHILAATHVHLSHHICAEMIMIKGSGKAIEKFSNALRKLKGVLHVGFSASSTGEKLS
ncbi:MAG: nickel-responsive transcriptional regulator NikR [Lentisphaerae bacterium]|nr:nickel-responsive transcriptional regulator NikR [Lentisphaerota bacterium]